MEKPVPDPATWQPGWEVMTAVGGLFTALFGWVFREQHNRIARLETAMADLAKSVSANELARNEGTDLRRAEFTSKIDHNHETVNARIDGAVVAIGLKMDAQTRDIEARWASHARWQDKVEQNFQSLRDAMLGLRAPGHAD